MPGLEAERYEIFFNSHAEYLSYLESFYERKRFTHLVNTIHIEQTTKRGMCSTFHSAAVYIERIPIRLFEIIESSEEKAFLRTINIQEEAISKNTIAIMHADCTI